MTSGRNCMLINLPYIAGYREKCYFSGLSTPFETVKKV
jgi:hypothetical protein